MCINLEGDATARELSSLLLDVDNGRLPIDKDGMVTVPSRFAQVVESVEVLYNKVYPNLALNYKNHKWLCERAILAPKNDMVSTTNNQLLRLIPEEEQVYMSVDMIVDISKAVPYPTEFLNPLKPPGMPPHNLKLRKGCPVMLLHNLDAPKLCNGTILVIVQMMSHVLQVSFLFEHTTQCQLTDPGTVNESSGTEPITTMLLPWSVLCGMFQIWLTRQPVHTCTSGQNQKCCIIVYPAAIK